MASRDARAADEPTGAGDTAPGGGGTAAAALAGSPPARARGGRRELARTTAQLALSFGALFAGVALAAHLAHDELYALGNAFVQRFGLAGMFAGVYLADAFSFPVPPQFYMLTAIAGGGSQVAPMATVCAASLLAGYTGYHLAGRIARVRFFAARIEKVRPRVDRLFARYGAWALAIGSLTPVPFSMLCYLAGLYRLPMRHLALLLLFRVPRLFVFYALIRLGWAQGG
jgi:membrane protein YqaA with SNARE-associated domain